ncbi:MFS general substrate transporter [Neoconidiobolus thromboides FSU 785]|nr:MFS general substrate transporter [Neoconidiobolus thromboides FSU 785]
MRDTTKNETLSQISEKVDLSNELGSNSTFREINKDVLDEESEEKSQLDGIQGWIVVTASFFNLFALLGIVYSGGIYIKYYADELFKDKVSLSTISLIATLNTALFTLLALFSGRFADEIGYRKATLIGSVIYSLGLLLASFSFEVWHLFLTQGIMVGIGGSITFLPAVSAPSQWFNKHIGLATGVVVAGSGIGGLVLNPLIQYILNHVGFRWTLRIQAIISIVILPTTSLFLKERVKVIKKKAWIDFSKFKDRRFLAIFFGGAMCSFGYLVPFFLMNKYAQSINLSDTQGAILVGLLNGGSAIGRVALGTLGDRCGRINTLIICVVLTSFFCFFVWTFSYTFGILALFNVLYGVVSGGIVSMSPVIVVQLFGVEGIASINGLLYFASGIPNLVGTPIASAILTASSSNLAKPNYIPVIMYSGTSAFLGAVIYFILKLMVNRKVFVRV